MPANPQPPGPPAPGQAPQALGGGDAIGADALGVANTESCFSSCREWQDGHSGTVLERTKASKAWPQSLQAYS